MPLAGKLVEAARVEGVDELGNRDRGIEREEVKMDQWEMGS